MLILMIIKTECHDDDMVRLSGQNRSKFCACSTYAMRGLVLKVLANMFPLMRQSIARNNTVLRP